MSMLTFYEQKENIPSWFLFMRRVKWNYSVEKFRTQWFVNLTEKEKKLVMSSMSDIIFSELGGEYKTTQKNAEMFDKNIQKLRSAFANNHKFLTPKQSRDLYDLINHELSFAVAKTVNHKSYTTKMPINTWLTRMLNILDNNQDKFFNSFAEKLEAEQKKQEIKTVKTPKTFDHIKELKNSTLPSKTKERINSMIKVLNEKQEWNLDGKTCYEINKIMTEYIPEMVETYTDITKTGNEANINKIHYSIKNQLTILEKYVEGINERFVHSKIYSMELQHQLISDKYEKSTLTVE